MSVKLTSPVLGHDVDYVYTGDEEAWLLANGYAKRDADTAPTSYTGAGVSNTGAASSDPDDDLTLASNRESAPDAIDQNHVGGGLPDPGPLDPAMTFSTADDDPNDADLDYDFDQGGVNDDAPSAFTVDPAEGLAAGGTAVTIKGDNLTGTTGVSLEGTAFTSVVVVDDETVTAVSPAKAAGTYDVVVTNANGSKTQADAFTTA